MTDLLTAIAGLHRPRLLIRAARAGLGDYNRLRDLRRLIRTPEVPGPDAAVRRLLDEEHRLEETRQAGDASYSMTRHIEVLIAMMVEATALPQTVTPAAAT